MGAWDVKILGDDVNEEFLDELNDLDDDEVVEAVRDACVLAGSEEASEEEIINGRAAATVAAIWAGAPFSAGAIADEHPFIRRLIGTDSEELSEAAGAVLEAAEVEEDLEVYLEALS
ncbi:hypothetical protein CFRA_02990 [Corynebacterium frankenforstense DSM 45800]|uniref:DUF4259 domain-containing protein n=1 Tax=Corynebacterium frankenforstense DSM 45800 TaxID=1437875 RepID=A0A1L7CRG8_9CORY|nr:hypothetical protein [Corynebacterium frankenforstense]APT88411.1 hypothetical protein CFRA_02990 [Corynebacterium frankenforstense DSM 45800]